MTIQNIDQLYRRVIASTDRLERLEAMDAPDIVLRNEHRVLQDALGALQALVPADSLPAGTSALMGKAA